MPSLFRRPYSISIPSDAQRTTIKGVPSARFKHNGKTITARLTKAGDRALVDSPHWYCKVEGKVIRLYTDKAASQSQLAELLRKAERKEGGMSDPFERHRGRPLADHLQEWADAMRSDIARMGQSPGESTRTRGEKHIRDSIVAVGRIIDVCKFETMADISASRLQSYLGEQRKPASVRIVDPAKERYTRRELAELLGVGLEQVGSLVRHYRLRGEGLGKRRRYPRETAERLCAIRSKGSSIKTCNLHLGYAKAFCRWLVRDRRMLVNPLEHLAAGNVRFDRRHDRRLLDEQELRLVIGAANASDVLFRDLEGSDRAMLYRTACATGFRTSELAALCPRDFKLAGDAPEVRLSASFAKNGKEAVQPIPLELAAALKLYFVGKPNGKPVWPGGWWRRSADMLRVDLDACGIPYTIEGPDGLLYADFHCLRHSFIAMLDRSGATLKEAMQLARHSDPRLTMAIYGRARLHDLAGAVDRLPSLGEPCEKPKASVG